jgi:hypothetical protein
MRWVNAERRKPEAFETVLGYCGGEQVELVAYDGISAFVGTDGCIVDHVSHWMEIPFPPPLQDGENGCQHCRHHMTWQDAQAIADRINKSGSRIYSSQDYTAEDVMCDNEMAHCIPCAERNEETDPEA